MLADHRPTCICTRCIAARRAEARRAELAEARRAREVPRLCGCGCGVEVVPGPTGRQYASDACRQRDYRRRRRAAVAS